MKYSMPRATLVLGMALLAGAAADATLTTEDVVSGLEDPVFITSAPGDVDRLFIVERPGRIRVLEVDGYVLLPTPFLDISAGTTTEGERGLLGLAFHPDYETNGVFFVHYTGLDGETILERYTVSQGDPNLADPASDTVFMTQDQPGTNHNGGMIAFRPGDPNNYLYIALGDGGSGLIGDPSQDLTTRWGTILRIDVDAGPGADPSTPVAPASNPFVDGPGGNDDLIWAYGLRNPWRFSFDRDTGDLYLGDVGAIAREEVDFEPGTSTGGLNYGWMPLEGTANNTCELAECDEWRENSELPIYEYSHLLSGVLAVVGGYVYRGEDIPALQGTYIFADLGGQMWSFVFDPTAPVEEGVNPGDVTDVTALLNPAEENIVSFGEDLFGELYIVEQDGTIRKIIDESLGDPNGDGTINSTDALWIIQAEFGLREGLTNESSDLNDDGVINSTDALWVIQIEFGLRPAP